jgi:hypothetical protein
MRAPQQDEREDYSTILEIDSFIVLTALALGMKLNG